MTDGEESLHLVVSCARQADSLFKDCESVPASANKYLPGICEFDALLISLEYRKSNTVFQVCNLLAQCRLSDL